MFRKDDTKSATNTLNPRDAKISYGRADVADEPSLKKITISAFQCQFMIMNNRAAHRCRRLAPPQLCPVSSKYRSASIAAMQPVPAAVTAWR